MRSGYPDCPEAVALALMEMIKGAEGEGQQDPARRGRNRPRSAELLDLYAECLAAVNGDRATVKDLTMH